MRDREDIRRIVELCDCLDDRNPDQRYIKKYLTQLLLIKSCAMYENRTSRIVYDRARKSCDKDAASLISSVFYAYKHLNLDALKGNIVGKFSEEHKREFSKRIKEFEDSYNAIVNDRNAVAHGRNIAITYGEFKRYSDAADGVLAEMERCWA